MKLLVAALVLFPCALNAQYNGPESVEHDHAGQRYFISNTGSSTILQRAYDGTVSAFTGTLSPAPYGLELQGDTLFACMGGSVHGFSTANGAEVFNLNLGGTFLNGITSDGVFLYVTDFSAKKIFKLSPGQGTFTTLVANTVSTPNGIVWDEGMDRLWVACWGGNAPIKAYDRNSGLGMGSFTTALSNIDGIALDCQGRIIVASWAPDRISRFENTFSDPPVDLAVPGLDNPADLDYDAVNDRICVPNSGNNTVAFAEVTDCTSNVKETVPYGNFKLWPNPTDGLLQTDLRVSRAVPFLVFNSRGMMVGSGTLSPHGQLDIAELGPGSYVLEVPSLRKRAKFIRQ
ncbi:MAG: SMP-30/gluconolactonase/LRE family protein [Bacteroidetes bacterium]|nr:SMP-30/gluconolactonase/LRE family protein [Bacteroidota bacterium]